MNRFSSLPDWGTLFLLLDAYVVLRFAPFLFRGLLEYLLRRTLSKIDSETAGQPVTRRALRRQVENTPGWMLKVLVARALLKARRRPQSERLPHLFLALG